MTDGIDTRSGPSEDARAILDLSREAKAWPTGVRLSGLRNARRSGNFSQFVTDEFEQHREVSPALLEELRIYSNSSTSDIVFHRIKVTKELIFRAQEFTRAFRFFDCIFEEQVNLNHAVAKSFEMTACHFVKGLSARHIHLADSLTLAFSVSQQTIDLTSASIGEHFNFRLGYCQRTDEGDYQRRYALILQRCRINGDCLVEGTLDDVDVADSALQLCEPEFRRERFVAEGGINLEGGVIRGRLIMTNGRFTGYSGRRFSQKSADSYDPSSLHRWLFVAVYGSQLLVERNAFLDKGFEAKGEVRFRNAEFRGNLDIEKAKFTCEKTEINELGPNEKQEIYSAIKNGDIEERDLESALNLDGVQIGRRLRLIDTELVGLLNLSNATAHTFQNDKESRPETQLLDIENFSYTRFIPHREYVVEDRIAWIKLQSTAMQDPNFNQQPWNELAAALKEIGDIQSARDVRRKMEWERTHWMLRKLFHHRITPNFAAFLKVPMRTRIDRVLVPFRILLNVITFLIYLALIPVRYVANVILRFLYVLLRYFHGMTVDFGYHPLWGIGWSLLVVFFGMLVYDAAHEDNGVRHAKEDVVVLAHRVREEDNVPNEIRYEPFNPFMFSLDVFLPFMNFDQNNYWIMSADRTRNVVPENLDNEKEDLFEIMSVDLAGEIGRSPTYTRIWFWIQTGLGWVLTTLTGLAFTGIVRRD